MPLSLTDGQLSTVTKAAALLPPDACDNFLRSVGPRPRADGVVRWERLAVLMGVDSDRFHIGE